MKLETLNRKIVNRFSGFYPRMTNVVLGEGNTNASIMLIGEAAGKYEDIIGKPFVGRCGKLLDFVLNSVGINRDSLYITNVVKCRPPNNRTPTKEEINIFLPYLKFEIILINPKIIVTLGTVATNIFVEGKISKIRGNVYKFNNKHINVIIVPTFHPSYILRNPNKVSILIEDFNKVKKLEMGYD